MTKNNIPDLPPGTKISESLSQIAGENPSQTNDGFTESRRDGLGRELFGSHTTQEHRLISDILEEALAVCANLDEFIDVDETIDDSKDDESSL